MVRFRCRVMMGAIIVCDVTLVSIICYSTAPDRNGSHSHKKNYLPRKLRTKNTPKNVCKMRTFQKNWGWVKNWTWYLNWKCHFRWFHEPRQFNYILAVIDLRGRMNGFILTITFVLVHNHYNFACYSCSHSSCRR